MTKLTLDRKTGVRYGYDGCYITEIQNNKSTLLMVYIGSDEDRLERAAQAITLINSVKEDCGVLETMIINDGKGVLVRFKQGSKGLKKRDKFRENVLPQIAPLCRSDLCVSCGERLNESSVFAFTPSGVYPMHSECFDGAVEAVDNWKPDDKKHYNIVGGLIGALVGMLLGAALWTAIGLAGYIASLAALVMAFLIGKGYDILGGKPGKFKALLLVILVIAGVIIGTAGTTVVQAHNVYKEVESNLRRGGYVTFMGVRVDSEAEMITMLLKEMPTDTKVMKNTGLGFLFAALGCYGVIKTAGKHPDQPSKPRKLKGEVHM